MAQSADDWQRIETLLGGEDYTALSLAVADLSDEQRAELVPRLRAFVRPNPDDQFRRLNDAGLGIVGAGVLPDAVSLVSWLGNRYLGYHTLEPDAWSDRGRHVSHTVVPHVYFVLLERKVAWLGELAQRLAERLPKDPAYRTDLFELVSRLLSDTGQMPATTDGYVAGWVHSYDSRNFVTELAADPRLAALVPRFFEVEAVGVQFDHDPSWGVALAQAGAQGLIDRTTLLDSCVQRLRRGGKPGTTRAYLKVYENLTPSSDEMVEHLDDYLALLQAPLSTVAGMAQQALFTLDDLGRLPPPAFATASREVICRSEKKLVRAQLARMKVVAQRDRSLADDLARVVVGTFGSATADMMRAMVQFIVGQASILGDAVRVDIVEAAQALPIDLRADLVRVLGSTAKPQPTEASIPPRPVWPGPRRITAIDDLDEAARETTAVLRRGVGAVEAAVLEPVLEALVRFGTSRKDDLRAALVPLRDDELYRWMRSVPDYHDNYTLDRAVAALIAAAVSEPISAADNPESRAKDRFGSVLRLEVIDRVYEIADAMRSQPGPQLVSLPTWSTGIIGGADLLGRLTTAADNGWEPWSFDLEQALLRLDRDADVVASFAALGTGAGRRVADWHDPGPADVEMTTVPRHRHDWDQQVVDEPDALVANVRSHGEAGAIWGRLTQLSTHHPHGSYSGGPFPLCAPAILPRHRDVIAAHCVESFEGASESRIEMSSIGGLLVVLAEADGPIGVGVNLVVSYGLNAKTAESRRDAVDALVVLAARDQVPASELGRTLATLVNRRAVIVARIVDGLRTTAQLGAAAEIWDVIAALLGDVLSQQTAPTGLADLLGLAAEIAEMVRSPADIPGLAAMAATRGKSRQLVEARRLLRLLEEAG